MSDYAMPCLGETFDSYSAQLGAPMQTAVLAGAIMRRYRWRSSVVSVLFSGGRSAAAHYSYPTTQTDRRALPALLLDLHAADPCGTTVYCGETGALLTTHDCPHSAIAALDAETGSTRPLVVRDCLDLRGSRD